MVRLPPKDERTEKSGRNLRQIAAKASQNLLRPLPTAFPGFYGVMVILAAEDGNSRKSPQPPVQLAFDASIETSR